MSSAVLSIHFILKLFTVPDSNKRSNVLRLNEALSASKINRTKCAQKATFTKAKMIHCYRSKIDLSLNYEDNYLELQALAITDNSCQIVMQV